MTANATGTGSPTGTLAEAASAFDSILNPPPEDKQKEAEANGADAAAAEAAAAEAAAQPEGDDAAEAAEEPAAEGAENAEAADEQPEPSRLFTVRIDGKEEQVSESELLAGYSRTSDYTRKTQLVAEQRKAADSELQAARTERAEYATLLPKLRAALEAGMGPEPDWATLRQKDPVAAAVQWQERQERQQKLAGLRAEEQRVTEQRAREDAELAEQVGIEQRNKLLERLPSWRDEKVASNEAAAIQATLRSVGYSEDEMKIHDHRAMLIAWRAAQYDAHVARTKAVQKKVVTVPVVKPSGVVRKSGNEALDAAHSRFTKSGSVKDAAGLFAHLL